MKNDVLISFVVVCDQELGRASRAIESIIKWVSGLEKEIVVVHCSEKPIVHKAEEVKFVQASPNNDLGELRYRGAQLAKGEWVAFLEEHCEISGPGYEDGFLAIKDEGFIGIGGVINVNDNYPISRLLLLVNFFPFGNRLIDEQIQALPGYNAIYKKEALNFLGDDTTIFGYDQLMVEKLLNANYSVGLHDAICITHYFEKKLINSLKLNYFYNVGYGVERMKRSERSILKRIILVLKSFFIPITRTVKTILLVRQFRRSEVSFVISKIHLLFTIQVATFLGTLHGYLIGKGNSEVIFKNLELNIKR